MSAVPRLAAFVVVLGLAFAGGAAVGAAVGGDPAEVPPAEERHDSSEMDVHGSSR